MLVVFAYIPEFAIRARHDPLGFLTALEAFFYFRSYDVYLFIVLVYPPHESELR